MGIGKSSKSESLDPGEDKEELEAVKPGTSSSIVVPDKP
jgi:hypothetical protein